MERCSLASDLLASLRTLDEQLDVFTQSARDRHDRTTVLDDVEPLSFSNHSRILGESEALPCRRSSAQR